MVPTNTNKNKNTDTANFKFMYNSYCNVSHLRVINLYN